MRNRATKISSIRARDAVRAASPTVFYRLHEGAGTTFSDALGNGPDFILTGTGTPFANSGWITPNGTDDMLQVAQADMGILTDIFRMDDDYGQVLIGFDLWTDGSATGFETIVQAGVAASNRGHIGVGMSSSGANVSLSTRGIGSSTNKDDSFSAYSFVTNSMTNKRAACLVEIIKKTSTTLDANLYVSGALVATLADVAWTANSGTAPYSGSGGAYAEGCTLMGLQTSSTVTRRLGSLGSNSRISRLLAHKSARDTSLALAVARDMHFAPGDFPKSLRGA